jgi:hypothetical protein
VNKAEAHRLLDAAKAGANIDARDITLALVVTGDARDDTCQVFTRVPTSPKHDMWQLLVEALGA